MNMPPLRQEAERPERPKNLKEIPAWLVEKKGLKNVSLSRTHVTKLPENLDAWKSLKSLQLGDLNISAAEMARIRKALPDVAIVF